jgi:phosphatidylinositol alpha 1,6-mannosyltransferase
MISSALSSASPSQATELCVVYFCGTIERNKDGVTRTLEALQRYNSVQSIDSLFVTAVADAQAFAAPAAASPWSADSGETAGCWSKKKLGRTSAVAVRGIPLPRYAGYKLSVEMPHSIERALRKHEFAPSLVHLHTPCTLGLAGLSLARRRGVPVLATYHTHFSSYVKHHGWNSLEQPVRAYLRQFYNRCDAVIVPSQELLRELEDDGIRNGLYVPHGVDTNVFHPLFRSHAWRERVLGKSHARKKIILTVGRLVWEKNLRTFVHAVKPLIEHPDSEYAVVVVGTGPAEKEIRAMLPEAHFLGFQTGVDLACAFASSDVFVFPSDTETFGNVTLEAMASGLACVVADAGGSRDLVSDYQTGFLCHPQRPDEFRAAIVALMEDDVLRQRMSQQAFLKAQRYSWSEVFQQMHAIYHALIDRNDQSLRGVQADVQAGVQARLHAAPLASAVRSAFNPIFNPIFNPALLPSLSALHTKFKRSLSSRLPSRLFGSMN